MRVTESAVVEVSFITGKAQLKGKGYLPEIKKTE